MHIHPDDAIIFDRETRDFAVYHEGQLVGFVNSRDDGAMQLSELRASVARQLATDLADEQAERDAAAVEPCTWCGGDGCKSTMQPAFCIDCVTAMLRGEDAARKDLHRAPAEAPRCELCEAPAVLAGEQWTCSECCPIPATRDEATAAGLPCYDPEAEARAIVTQLNTVQRAIATAHDRPGFAHVLTLAHADLMVRLAAIGYTAVNHGGTSPYLLLRKPASVVTVYLPEAA